MSVLATARWIWVGGRGQVVMVVAGWLFLSVLATALDFRAGAVVGHGRVVMVVAGRPFLSMLATT